jgi:hypothetical protein
MYDGGRIVHDSVVPSARPVVGEAIAPTYSIDVREFLTSEKNALLRRAIHTDLRAMLLAGSGSSTQGGILGSYATRWEYFCSGAPGSYDYIAQAVSHFVFTRIRYKADKKSDCWQFPDETLRLGTGDCEDIAFLLASLLLAAGISAYNIRVALGSVREVRRSGEVREYDHVWVAYKNEMGQWIVIEPLLAGRAAAKPGNSRGVQGSSFEYRPAFAWNGDHLWRLRSDAGHGFRDALSLEREWGRFRPTFAGRVHRSIVTDAFALLPQPHPLLLGLLHSEFTVFVNDPNMTVDWADMPWRYHPFDHFDSGFISESWARVRERAESCLNPSNAQAAHHFGLVAHAVADFYAHTSYAHFATRDGNGKLLLAKTTDWQDTPLARDPDYSPGSDFDLSRFAPNPNWRGDSTKRVSVWNRALLSGRWRFPGDFGVDPNSTSWLQEVRRPRMDLRNGLPLHDEIAVDKAVADGGANALYAPQVFAQQFSLRYDAAVRHIAMLLTKYGTELFKLG